jgi:hypothetical protein
MDNINIRDWQKKYLLKEEVEKPLDEFAVNFHNPELTFELVEESDIDHTIQQIVQQFSRLQHLQKTKQLNAHQAMQELEQQVEKEVVALVIKAATSAQREVGRLTGEE